ncbi:hypothetical protein vseg_006427 [Gypsophila vaccaria]
MGSLMGEERHLENVDSSLMSPPICKRRKVSGVRDFPRDCGPNTAPLCKQTKAKELQGVDGLNVNDVLKAVMNDVEGCEEMGGDFCEAEKGVLKQTVQSGCQNGAELSASSLPTCGNVDFKNEELKNFATEKPNTFEDIQILGEKCILTNEIRDSYNDFTDKKDSDTDNNCSREEGFSAEQRLLPHCPVPPVCLMTEPKYPLPRRVSAVRDFPTGSGGNVTSLGQNYQVAEVKSDTKTHDAGILNLPKEKLEGNKNYENEIQDTASVKSDFTGEKHSVANEEAAVEVNMQVQATILGHSSEYKVPEINVEDYNNASLMLDTEQSRHVEKDNDIDSLSDRLQNNIADSVKIKKRNKKLVGVSSNHEEFQDESNTDNDIEKRITVQGLVSADSCQWRQEKVPAKLSPSRVSARESKGKKHEYAAQDKQKRACTQRNGKTEKSMVVAPYLIKMDANEVSRQLTLNDIEDSVDNEEHNEFQLLPKPQDCDSLPLSSVVDSSNERGARSNVRGTLKLFQALVRKLLQEEETKPKEMGRGIKRVDLSAGNVLKEKGRYINTKKRVGSVPGVEIGDIFSYRIELAIVGIHSPLQSGIDTIREGKQYIAISIVASGGYDNDVDSSDVLIYTGQGGNPIGADKQPENQKLGRGNLALKNCIDEKNPVRVVRGFKETKPPDNGDGKPKITTTYTYDGLYTVVRYWHEVGHHGTLVYKFELIRNPGQRELAWKEMKQTKKCKVRQGCCVDDISEGKDKPPICAINTIDDDKPPPFTYITSMMYPDWCRPVPLTGCNCKGGCSDSDRCACAVKNGGEIPYNLNGAIVMAKPLVYECGPFCNCPPSCPNRVSQHGMKLPLEIFKTESRGWGVRCLSSISSGSFICEYIGELLDDKQAEQRAGNDEYLFDIGQNYNDITLSDGLSALMPNMPSNATDVVENVGFTIDAARYGNIGRFINHSCSPNLYAQNVLYDHEDKRIPHIMLFAAENIPPLEELTYHYNYTIDQVFDSKGNIKRKNCYCGSAECSGRMY